MAPPRQPPSPPGVAGAPALSLWPEPPMAAQSQPGPPRTEPSHLPAEATKRALAAQQRVLADSDELRRLGIQIMELSTDGDSVTFLVPVADRRTIQILQQRYGPVE